MGCLRDSGQKRNSPESWRSRGCTVRRTRGWLRTTSVSPMTEESKAKPAPPLRGMIEIDGQWQIRRFGLLTQRRLTCIYGHRIKLDARPFEIAIPCNFRTDRELNACPAQLYIFTTRPRLVWAMDLTHAESTIIDQHSMDVEEIVSYFGVGFPIDMKIPRLGA